MNGPQHYTEAQELLRRCPVYLNDEQKLAAAQAHAMLALTAAIIDAHDNSADTEDWGRRGRQLVRYTSRWEGGEGGEEITTPASDWARALS